MTTIALLGPPGSGKGTLAAALAARSRLATFDTGATLRAWAAVHDAELAAVLAEGNMAPTPLVMDLVGQTLGQVPAGARGWVLDGTPRNAEQAGALVERWRQGRFPLTALIVLEADVATVTRRLQRRVVCARCNRSAIAGSATECECGGALRVRSDDTGAGIARRLDLYRELTEPAIRIVTEAGIPVRHLDAAREAERVTADAERWLQGLARRAGDTVRAG